MSAYLQYIDEDTGVVARWHGGEYIELGYVAEQDTGPFNNLRQPSYRAGEFVAGDVINVWDHAKNEPRIGFHIDEFEECVKSHLNDDEEEEDA